MNRIADIVPGLEKCNGKCRKCSWRDGFSSKCTLMNTASEYIRLLEVDNAKKMIYCKDCIYCEKEKRRYNWENDSYTCKNRDGLPIIPCINPLDFCSRGVTRKETNDENA